MVTTAVMAAVVVAALVVAGLEFALAARAPVWFPSFHFLGRSGRGHSFGPVEKGNNGLWG